MRNSVHAEHEARSRQRSEIHFPRLLSRRVDHEVVGLVLGHAASGQTQRYARS
jgi:hypothetical protein